MTDLSFYVPHISRESLDAEATAFLEAYCPEAIKAPTCIPIESIAADKMKLTVLEYHLSEDLSILGQMCFTDGRAEIYDPDKEEYREIVVKAGTMIIDPDPTMKPIPLLAYPIKNSSAPNAVVLDLFGGSGSTLIACEQTDRICRTMELDPKYATVIVERFHMEYPDQEITVLRDGQTLPYDSIAVSK